MTFVRVLRVAISGTPLPIHFLEAPPPRFLGSCIWLFSLLAEVSHDEAKVRERRESLSFLSLLPRRERPLLAGNWLLFFI